MKNSVPVGLGTIVGYGSALLSAAIAALEALNSSGASPESVKWLGILSAVLVGLTTIGRQFQAASGVPVPQPEPFSGGKETPPVAPSDGNGQA